MPNPLLGLVSNPLAVASDVLGQPFCPRPSLSEEVLIRACVWVDRTPPGEHRRNLNHRFVDKDGDRIQVACERL